MRQNQLIRVIFLLSRKTEPGLDVGSGCLFCIECNNFIYDETIEQVYTSGILYTEEKTTRFQGTFVCMETSVTSKIFPVSQMLRESYSPWVPNEQETAALEGAVAIPCQGKMDNPEIAFKFPSKVHTRSTRIVESWSNVFHECRIAVLDPQPSGPQLFPQ